MQKGQSYLIFADNDTTANEVDGNIYNNAYPIVFDLEQSEPSVFKSEKGRQRSVQCKLCIPLSVEDT